MDFHANFDLKLSLSVARPCGCLLKIRCSVSLRNLIHLRFPAVLHPFWIRHALFSHVQNANSKYWLEVSVAKREHMRKYFQLTGCNASILHPRDQYFYSCLLRDTLVGWKKYYDNRDWLARVQESKICSSLTVDFPFPEMKGLRWILSSINMASATLLCFADAWVFQQDQIIDRSILKCLLHTEQVQGIILSAWDRQWFHTWSWPLRDFSTLEEKQHIWKRRSVSTEFNIQ